MIIETCPNCGNDLTSLILTCYPPIPKKQCMKCGWSWTGKQENIERVTFEPSISYDNTPNINDMKIYLLDINKYMTDAWSDYFTPDMGVNNVEIVNKDFATFMDAHPEIEAVVSPANSFGIMDGGYDRAITEYFGEELMDEVQSVILDKWYGIQPVGTSISVPIVNRIVQYDMPECVISKCAILIHTPSMIVPEHIMDHRVVYQCMRTCLIEAMKHDVKTIVIPAFGGSTGAVQYEVAAKMMYLAYHQIQNKPKYINWEYAARIDDLISLRTV